MAEPVLGFGTTWAVIAAVQTDARGDFGLTARVPPGAWIQYQPFWLTGLSGAATPFRSTAPLGGVVF
ncbi:MAG: hypothetical protein AAF628_37155 [Planctomycetota bacterium]